MRPRLTTNVGELIRKMNARQGAVRRELSREAVEIKGLLLRESKAILNRRIYSVEIPFRKTTPEKVQRKYAGTSRQQVAGRNIRQWRRTGNLLNRERATVDGTTVILSNDAEYALARFYLGTPKGQGIKTPGVQSVQWQLEAVQKHQREILERRREALHRGLERP